MSGRPPLIPRCMLAGLAVAVALSVPFGLLLSVLVDRIPVGFTAIVLIAGVFTVAGAASAVHDRLHVCSVCGLKHADHDV